MKPGKSTVILMGTGLLVALSVGLFLHGLTRQDFYRRQLENRARERAELVELRRLSEDRRAALDWINAQAPDPGRLSALLRAHWPDGQRELTPRESRALGEGWTEQRYELRLDGAALDALPDFIAACAAARPPIRVRELQATATGAGSPPSVQLVLSELQRGAPP
ncbi:MAG TPA: hypothetical protein PKE26_10630 [Kiritimatiellia bacterium]|nr:hypothetical protein [Kiritimatiellia bacterium]HMO99553.1 hypothetical protein [Kiritimatiellia bacterium]HMP97453.1 hypothetical protein [Kiritimatiellia bacterium]